MIGCHLSSRQYVHERKQSNSRKIFFFSITTYLPALGIMVVEILEILDKEMFSSCPARFQFYKSGQLIDLRSKRWGQTWHFINSNLRLRLQWFSAYGHGRGYYFARRVDGHEIVKHLYLRIGSPITSVVLNTILLFPIRNLHRNFITPVNWPSHICASRPSKYRDIINFTLCPIFPPILPKCCIAWPDYLSDLPKCDRNLDRNFS